MSSPNILSCTTTAFDLISAALISTSNYIMTTTKRRAQHTAADFLASQHPDRYPEKVLQSLVKHLGLKMASKMIKSCHEEEALDAKHRDNELGFDALHITPGMMTYYMNARRLQRHVVRYYKATKGATDFYTDCERYLGEIMRPLAEEGAIMVETKSPIQSRVFLQIEGFSFNICFLLASIHLMKESHNIVKSYNIGLTSQYVATIIKRRQVRNVVPQARKLFDMYFLLSYSIRAIVGEKRAVIVEMNLRMAEERLIASQNTEKLLVD